MIRRLLQRLHDASPWLDLTHVLRDLLLCSLFIAVLSPFGHAGVAWLVTLFGAYRWEAANASEHLGHKGWFSGLPPNGWTHTEVGDLLGSVLGVLIAQGGWLAIRALT